MLYELALHPDVQEKMHEEVTRVIGTNKSPSIEKYYELIFVRNAVQETLRKRPPISLIPKLCRTKTTIGDYEIPENTEVYLNAYEAQHDERYWKSPHSFIPERFDPTSDYYTKRPSGTLIPFSIGHRKCIGSRYEFFTLIITLKDSVKLRQRW
jgi:cytochrome P450